MTTGSTGSLQGPASGASASMATDSQAPGSAALSAGVATSFSAAGSSGGRGTRELPWAEVVANSPKLASGARRLWRSVAGRSPAAAVRGAPVEHAGEGQAVNALKTRLLELEEQVGELQAQMLECTGVVRALAEQNTQLVWRLDSVRSRLVWLAGGATVMAVLMAIGGVVLGVLLPG